MKPLFDITIVGGGMVGRALALGLSTHDETKHLRVALIDGGQPEPLNLDHYDARVVALSARSQQFLERIDAWQGIINTRACPYHNMIVWDGDGTGRIHFSSDDIHAYQLGHIVESSVINASLNEKLNVDRAPSLQIFEGVSVTGFSPKEKVSTKEGDKHTLHLSDERVIKTTLVVGVDGANSFIRKQTGIKTRTWSYGHSAIVTTLNTTYPHKHTARQRFTQTGPIALLPLESSLDQRTCSLVWSIDSAKAQSLMALDDNAFCQVLSRETESILGDITHTDKRVSIALNQCHAKRYIDDGVVLAGDAAHVIHPLAGLGANLGFADVNFLFDEIIRTCSRGLALDNSQMLRRYERIRQGENLSVMAAMEAFKRVFGADNILVRYGRNIGLKQCNNSAIVKKSMTRFMC